MNYKRIFVIVCDSMGIGNAKDADKYDDLGTNTVQHICEKCDGLNVPTLEKLGFGLLGDFKGINKISYPKAYVMKLNEVSNGKDTMTGHWEMMGLKTVKPFITFTDTGFPDEFIKLFEEKTGRKCVGNIACSGTKILDMYGEHQLKTGDWIVYTSADSVFQIAAHEDIIPLDELYKACEIAREIAMDDRWKVGRVIARPYIGSGEGQFTRTANRHDYALAPFAKTGVFWMAYLFGVIAIAYQIYVFKISFDQGEDVKSKFYGFPIARVGVIYLAVQLVLSLIEMCLAAIVPMWVSVIINILPIAFALIGCIAAEVMRDEIVRQDIKIKTDVGNMRALQSQTASFVGMCQDAVVKKQLQDLADDFKYSDPVSSESTKEMETELKFLVNEIQRALVDGDMKSVEGFLVRAKEGLAERNRVCKLGK